MKKKGGLSKFLFAGALGAVAGLLLSPATGKQNREKAKKMATNLAKKLKKGEAETQKIVKDVFGNKGAKAVAEYEKIKKEILTRVADISQAGKSIDKKKYVSVVDEVTGEFKDEIAKAKGGVAKLSAYLKKDWTAVKRVVDEDQNKKKK